MGEGSCWGGTAFESTTCLYCYGFAPFCSTHGVPRLGRCYQLFDIAGAIEEGVVGICRCRWVNSAVG
jgi:hypothetical protein